MQSLSAGLATPPFALSFESVAGIVPGWRLIVSLAYLGFFVSIFAYLLWFHLLKVLQFSLLLASGSMPNVWGRSGRSQLGAARIHPNQHLSHGATAADLAGIVPVAFGIYLVTHPASKLMHIALGGTGDAAAPLLAASSYHFLMPPLSLIFGWFLLGEQVVPFPVIANRLPCYFLSVNRQEIPKNRLQPKARGMTFHLEIEISLYFSPVFCPT